jgi:hypothetical protein
VLKLEVYTQNNSQYWVFDSDTKYRLLAFTKSDTAFTKFGKPTRYVSTEISKNEDAYLNMYDNIRVYNFDDISKDALMKLSIGQMIWLKKYL